MFIAPFDSSSSTTDRSQFLKVFHNVRTHMEIPHPPGQEEYAQKADGKA